VDVFQPGFDFDLFTSKRGEEVFDLCSRITQVASFPWAWMPPIEA
jgi:hypothetical protein